MSDFETPTWGVEDVRKNRVLAAALCIIVAATLGLAGCTEDKAGQGDTTGGKTGKPAASDKLLLPADVERVLDVENVTVEKISLNPETLYQGLFNSGEKRLLIINVTKADYWDKIASVPTTEPIEGLGDKALRSDSQGIVFVKGDRLVAIGSFGGHPGSNQATIPADRLIELAILVAARM